MKTFTDEEIRFEIAHLKRGYAPRLREMVESLLAERSSIAAVALERAAIVCRDYLRGPMPASSAVDYLPQAIRSLIPTADADARKVVEDAERYMWLLAHVMWIHCTDDDSEAGNFTFGEKSSDLKKISTTIDKARGKT